LRKLVTASLADYESLALTLARDAGALAALRQKLVRNIAAAPLFDADRSRRNLEAAYRRWQRLRRAAARREFRGGRHRRDSSSANIPVNSPVNN